MASLVELIAKLLTAAPWVFVALIICAIVLLGAFAIGIAVAVHSIAKYLTRIVQIVLAFVQEMTLMIMDITVYKEIKICEAKPCPEDDSNDDGIKHLLRILPLRHSSDGEHQEREAKGTSTTKT